MTVLLAGIRIHPIKALDPVSVQEATIAPGGALAGDRRWALFDPEGNFVNGKRDRNVHRIRARYAPDAAEVELSSGEHRASFMLGGDLAPIEAWLSRELGRPLRIGRNDEVGFPDDLEASGPTLVSSASLERVAGWYPPLTADGVRRRFRVNLEVAGVEAFWEDRLINEVRFRVGGVLLQGTNSCQRCVVPTRDADTGEALPGFQKIFAARREESLPGWADRARFNHFYRFTLNTRIQTSEAGKVLRVGDPVEILEAE